MKVEVAVTGSLSLIVTFSNSPYGIAISEEAAIERSGAV